MNLFQKDRTKMGLNGPNYQQKLAQNGLKIKKVNKKCKNVSKRAKNSQRLTEIHKKWTKVA